MATKATNVSLYYFLYYLKYSVKWSETKIVCRAQDVVIIDMFLIRNLFLSFFMFIVILQIQNIFLVSISLMVMFGYFRCLDFTILRDCCCAVCAETHSGSRLVRTSWSIVFSFDTLNQVIILWGYDKIPVTDPGWVSPWQCEIGHI